jgi:hypothetical protein
MRGEVSLSALSVYCPPEGRLDPGFPIYRLSPPACRGPALRCCQASLTATPAHGKMEQWTVCSVAGYAALIAATEAREGRAVDDTRRTVFCREQADTML